MTPARKIRIARLLHAVDGVGPAGIVAAVQSAPLDNALVRAGLVHAVERAHGRPEWKRKGELSNIAAMRAELVELRERLELGGLTENEQRVCTQRAIELEATLSVDARAKASIGKTAPATKAPGRTGLRVVAPEGEQPPAGVEGGDAFHAYGFLLTRAGLWNRLADLNRQLAPGNLTVEARRAAERDLRVVADALGLP